MAKKKEYRHGVGLRYDLLDPDFIKEMAAIMSVGSQKYGDNNWKQGLTGENSGLNHAIKHLQEYMAQTPNDYGDLHMHLAQVAVNAMFEAHFYRKAQKCSQTQKK